MYTFIIATLYCIYETYDSTEFVKIVDQLQAFTGNCILVTMDVTSLNTNIPDADGLKAIANIISGKEHIIPNYNILKLLEMVLHAW